VNTGQWEGIDIVFATIPWTDAKKKKEPIREYETVLLMQVCTCQQLPVIESRAVLLAAFKKNGWAFQ
jgi:hypothetical protein